MAIKIRGQDLQARYINNRSVVKVMRGSVEIRPNSWYPTEVIIYKMKAWASGNLYVPISTRGGWTGSDYNWKISIDGWPETVYSGVSSTWSDITIGTWYTPDSVHTIMIRPVLETYGWAKAFSCYNVWIANLIIEVVQDLSYKWFAKSATETWNGFRAYQYTGCSLTTVPPEVLPDGVTTIGQNFRENQYYGCSSLTTATNEVIPNSVTSIWSNFRWYQYMFCTDLTSSPNEVIPASAIMNSERYRNLQYYGCTSLTTAGSEADGEHINNKIWRWYRQIQYGECTSLITAPNEVMSNNVTNIETDFRYGQYSGCTSLVTAWTEAMSSSISFIDIQFRNLQYWNCNNLTTANIQSISDSVHSQTWNFRASQFSINSGTRSLVVKVLWNEIDDGLANAWLQSSNCSQIEVPSSLLTQYQSRYAQTIQSLFVWY